MSKSKKGRKGTPFRKLTGLRSCAGFSGKDTCERDLNCNWAANDRCQPKQHRSKLHPKLKSRGSRISDYIELRDDEEDFEDDDHHDDHHDDDRHAIVSSFIPDLYNEQRGSINQYDSIMDRQDAIMDKPYDAIMDKPSSDGKKSGRKSVRKSSRKNRKRSRKSGRKSSRKRSRKRTRKSLKKRSRKSGRKSLKKRSRKSGRKSGRKRISKKMSVIKYKNMM